MTNSALIDLRSDTVTKPCGDMLKAMAAADVGDDVFSEDPTVALLEETLAERSGQESGLFFPSGTQSNLVALLTHCQRGDEYIVGQNAHTYKYEGGGAAVLGSIQPQPIEHDGDGTMPIEKIKAVIKPDDFHFARTKLLALENTIGGKIIPQSYISDTRKLASQNKLVFHLDGARVFNAMVAQGVELDQITRQFDSVSICLSKGLGAPVGSVLASSKDVIDQARRWRKMVGGGMRQAGILAAAGLFAIDNNVNGLEQDHLHAQRFAESMVDVPGIEVVGDSAHTNMVFLKTAPEHSASFLTACSAEGVLFTGGAQMRLVFHKDVSLEMTSNASNIVQSVAERLKLG